MNKKSYAEPRIGQKEGFWVDFSSEINFFMVSNMFKHTFDHISTCGKPQKPSKQWKHHISRIKKTYWNKKRMGGGFRVIFPIFFRISNLTDKIYPVWIALFTQNRPLFRRNFIKKCGFEKKKSFRDRRIFRSRKIMAL